MDLAMESVPDPWFQLSYRRREEEINLESLIGETIQDKDQ